MSSVWKVIGLSPNVVLNVHSCNKLNIPVVILNIDFYICQQNPVASGESGQEESGTIFEDKEA